MGLTNSAHFSHVCTKDAMCITDCTRGLFIIHFTALIWLVSWELARLMILVHKILTNRIRDLKCSVWSIAWGKYTYYVHNRVQAHRPVKLCRLQNAEAAEFSFNVSSITDKTVCSKVNCLDTPYFQWPCHCASSVANESAWIKQRDNTQLHLSHRWLQHLENGCSCGHQLHCESTHQGLFHSLCTSHHPKRSVQLQGQRYHC